MKYCKYCIGLGLVLVTGMVLAYTVLVSEKPNTNPDQRVAISLSPREQGYVLGQMRAYLGNMQGITAAISRQQMLTVANLASEIGADHIPPAPKGLAAKLPPDFKQISLSVHDDFDHLAQGAREDADPVASLRQLSDITAKCVACHASYRLSPAAG